MKTRSWKSVLKKYQKGMGSENGTLYAHLLAEFLDLKYKWDEFVELYGTNQERVNILNSSASQFWAFTHNVLFDDILIHIARLTDKESTFKRKNLSVQTLSSMGLEEKLQRKLKRSIDKVIKDSEFCRDWRNRRIAHIDYNYRTSNKEKLKRATRGKVSKCISGIHAVLNLVEKRYFDSDIYPNTPRMFGAYDLLRVIDDGLRLNAERELRLRSGNVLPQDYQEPERSWS